MLQSTAGHDPWDPIAAEAMPDLLAGMEAGVKGLKVGIPAEYTMDGGRG